MHSLYLIRRRNSAYIFKIYDLLTDSFNVHKFMHQLAINSGTYAACNTRKSHINVSLSVKRSSFVPYSFCKTRQFILNYTSETFRSLMEVLVFALKEIIRIYEQEILPLKSWFLIFISKTLRSFD